MKLHTILILLFAVLAVVLLCVVIVASPSISLYEAKYDSYSKDHINPEIRIPVETKDSETILPMMEETMIYYRAAILELSNGEKESFKRKLSYYSDILDKLNVNINKLKLSKTNIHTFYQSADNIEKAMFILGDDYERILKLTEKLKSASVTEATTINNELRLIGSEIVVTVTLIADETKSMEKIAEEYSIDTKPLKNVLELLNSENFDAEGMYSQLYIDSLNFQAPIIYSMEPNSGVYGDTITISGKTTANTEIYIYCDSNLWKKISSDTNGFFSANLKIEKIYAGDHSITLSSNNEFSKSSILTVFPLDTEVEILSITQEEKAVIIRGVLKTETEVRVIDAPVLIINNDDGYIFAEENTNIKGVWEASVILNDGIYCVYAEFNDKKFPLFKSKSDIVEFTVEPLLGVSTFKRFSGDEKDFNSYYFILLILGGLGGFIIWRFIHRRKQSVANRSHKPKKITDKSIYTEDYITNTELDDSIEITEEELKNAEKTFLINDTEITSLSPSEISAPQSIREIYCSLIHTLARKYRIEYIDAKTPREISALLSPASKELTTFMNTYEYLRYSGVSITNEDILTLKTDIVFIPELSADKNTTPEGAI